MSNDYQLSLTPVRVTELPPADKLIAQGNSVLETTNNWKPGKTYHNSVRTFSRVKFRGEIANWHCRLSEHGPEDGTFDEFWERLAGDKNENEANYVETVERAILVKQVSPTQSIWTMHYKFPPPVSPRVFTVLQTAVLSETSPRTGILVSIPVDLSPVPEWAKLEENNKRVKGRYVSVERLRELPDGRLEWRMATTSVAGGMVLQSLTEMSMPANIAHDVPGFVNFLRATRPKPTSPVVGVPVAAEVHAAEADAQGPSLVAPVTA
ncbi:DUF3074 domain-containing protein [Phanerochaete sordida]|uniref:DUF3074 domain-containing protein n=1 Tax=Phanerochaete sordida TaxID=48140 RepID=A0A9P3GBB3_9APHY|nr:DUF3074 domain-containing protein [Phanerochaete sordida]